MVTIQISHGVPSRDFRGFFLSRLHKEFKENTSRDDWENTKDTLFRDRQNRPYIFGVDILPQLTDELPIQFYNWVDATDEIVKHVSFWAIRQDDYTFFFSTDRMGTCLFLNKDNEVKLSLCDNKVIKDVRPETWMVEL